MTEEGRYAFSGLDRVIHERARLGIMTSLMAEPKGILFPELKDLCQLTDGNLNRHLQVLEESRLIRLDKSGSGRTKQTRVHLTSQGQQQFLAYLDHLKAVVDDASNAVRQARKVKRHGLLPG